MTEDQYREAWTASIPAEFRAALAPRPQPTYGVKINTTVPAGEADRFRALARAQGFPSHGRYLTALVLAALDDPERFPVPSDGPEPRGGLVTQNALVPAHRHPALVAVAMVAGVSVAALVRAVIRDALACADTRVSG